MRTLIGNQPPEQRLRRPIRSLELAGQGLYQSPHQPSAVLPRRRQRSRDAGPRRRVTALALLRSRQGPRDEALPDRGLAPRQPGEQRPLDRPALRREQLVDHHRSRVVDQRQRQNRGMSDLRVRVRKPLAEIRDHFSQRRTEHAPVLAEL